MSKKLKLKGKNVKKIPKAKKKKMEGTLEKMQKIREEDNRNLRDLIKVKLNWAIKEKTKGLQVIKATQHQVVKLEGVILLAEDLLKKPTENEKSKS